MGGFPFATQSPQDEARIRIGMARALSTDSSMYLEILYTSVKSECHRAENPTLRKLEESET